MDLQSRDYQDFFDESITKFFSYGALLAQALHTRGVSSSNFLLSIHGRVKCLGCMQGVWDSKFPANSATLNTIISTYQQSPRTPCMMSSGLGLRNTANGMLDTLRPPPLKD